MTATSSLQSETLRCALAGYAVLGGIALGLCVRPGWRDALLWFCAAAVLWGWCWAQLSRRLTLNRLAADAPLYANLGLANRLTLVRGLLISCCAGYLPLYGQLPALAWQVALFYSMAAILDRTDGYIARRSRRQSLLGAQLDTVFDALGLLLAPVLAVLAGKVPPAYLLVSVAYYWFQWGSHWRRTHDLPLHSLHDSPLRRALAGFQMGYVAVVLWPFMHKEVTLAAGYAFMLPSLCGFFFDWMVVSGRIDPSRGATARLCAGLENAAVGVLLPLLRLVQGFALLLWLLQQDPLLLSVQEGAWRSPGLVAGMIVAGLMVLAGYGARIGALSMLCLLSLYDPGAPPGFASLALIACSVWILLLGGGRFSAWRWDDHWVNNRQGGI